VLLLPERHWGFSNLAALYAAPIVGAILGLVFSYFMLDIIAKVWARYHNGVIDPENRLVILWIVLPFKLVGYNLIGQFSSLKPCAGEGELLVKQDVAPPGLFSSLCARLLVA
jgi:hypothetical protein